MERHQLERLVLELELLVGLLADPQVELELVLVELVVLALVAQEVVELPVVVGLVVALEVVGMAQQVEAALLIQMHLQPLVEVGLLQALELVVGVGRLVVVGLVGVVGKAGVGLGLVVVDLVVVEEGEVASLIFHHQLPLPYPPLRFQPPLLQGEQQLLAGFLGLELQLFLAQLLVVQVSFPFWRPSSCRVSWLTQGQ